MPDAVETLAEQIWSKRLIHKDISEIATQYGFTQKDLDWLDWEMLPETIKEHVRDMAEKEIGQQ